MKRDLNGRLSKLEQVRPHRPTYGERLERALADCAHGRAGAETCDPPIAGTGPVWERIRRAERAE